METILNSPAGPGSTTARAEFGRIPVLALGTFAVGTDAFVLAGFLPDTAAALHVPVAVAGWAITIFAATYALLSPVLAAATARLPRRTVLVAALSLLGLANLGSAVAPTFPVLLATRALAAVGAAAYTPNAGAVASALVPERMRGRALAIVIGGLTVATALGVPAGDVIGHWTGWRTALAAVAAVCLIAAAGVALLIPRLPGGPAIGVRERFSVLRNRSVLAVLPATVLGMAAAYLPYAYAVPVFGAVGIGAGAVAIMLCLYGFGAVAGNLLAGWSTDRRGAVRVLSTGYLVSTLTFATLAIIAATHTAPVPLVALAAVGWGAASWSQSPPQQHRLITAAPAQAAIVVALNASGIYVGIGLGTLCGGLLVSEPVTLLSVASVLAAATAGYVRWTARDPRPQGEPDTV
ncbi:MFS transporter [Nocardia stercoris]|uniref:MFS transporter n=1 Tax=Nocardia stercoris TaxID=2483361 RepID=A0A3M2L3P7_9NOCA|nr:MFS transporter [Nocardia stercoris]RMI32277.1 MFS transporter [Nocardia stercoris]